MLRQWLPHTSCFRQSPAQIDHASTSTMHIYTLSKVMSSISLGNMLSYSFIGARRVITLISSRKSVERLVLSHNKLGNEGCVVLCNFLRSTIGKRYAISEIYLDFNAIENEGLSAISEFLKDDQHLKKLSLLSVSWIVSITREFELTHKQNRFSGDPTTTSKFVNAVNNSNLEVLSLSSNRSLSDAFVEVFLPALNAPSLRALYLSAMNLTPLSCPYILDFLTDPHRCHLHTLKCNGNTLGLQAVRSIIGAVARKNYALVTVELYANHLASDSLSDTLSSDHDSNGEDTEVDKATSLNLAWIACQHRMNLVLTRNALLKGYVEGESLQLLRYARILLLHTQCIKRLLPAPQMPNNVSPSFTSLPIEIQHHILSFLAPHLSAGQLIRIIGYASSANTLPCLLPRLRGNSILENIELRKEQKRIWFDTLRCSSFEPELD